MSNTGSSERYRIRWAIQDQVSNTGSGEQYRIRWAIQDQVSDTGSGEQYKIRWAIQDWVILKLLGKFLVLSMNITWNTTNSTFYNSLINHLLLQGLSGKTCAYGMGVRVITKFMTNIEEASTDKKYSYVILANKSKTLR